MEISSVVFSDETSNICICSFVSLFLILLFIVSPLNEYVKTSFGMKLIVLILLAYTIKLNISQIDSLNRAVSAAKEEQMKSLIQTNIICNYIFTTFLGILVIYVVKTFF